MDLKEVLNKGFQKGLASRYDSVSFLCIYWDDNDDPKFKEEASDITKLFSKDFHFKTEIYAIQSRSANDNCTNAISARINKFLHEESHGRQSLLILHYGGHGDINRNAHGFEGEAKLVWAAKRSAGPTASWFKIEPLFEDTESDVLIVMDCCYSGQGGRAPSHLTNRIEILAACHPNGEANSPGPYSFTTLFIKNTRALLDHCGRVVTTSLYELLRRDMPRQSPVLSPIGSLRNVDQGTAKMGIHLQPLNDKDQDSTRIAEVTATTLNLSIDLSMTLDTVYVQKMIDWLTTLRPQEVVGIKATSIKNLQHRNSLDSRIAFADGVSGGQSVMLRMHTPPKKDIFEMMQQIKEHIRPLRSLRPDLWRQPLTTNSEDRMELSHGDMSTLECLDVLVTSLLEECRRGLLSTPGKDQKLFSGELWNAPSQGIGFPKPSELDSLANAAGTDLCIPVDRLSLVDVNGDSESSETTLQLRTLRGRSDDTGSSTDRPVLVQYYTYEAQYSSSQTPVQKVYDLLNSAKAPTLASLRCIHWFHDPSSSSNNHGLVFEIPPDREGRPVSLADIITSTKGEVLPTLVQRLRIASEVGEALRQWHQSGWTHQRIGSDTVVFFREPGAKRLDYSRPYLTTFAYCQRCGQSDRNSKIYPRPRSDKHFFLEILDHDFKTKDVFAYGMLLFEIGLWKLERNVFPDRGSSADKFWEEVEDQADKLEFCMGTQYEQAAKLCLDPKSFSDVMLDHKDKERHAQVVLNDVVERLRKSSELDD